ncbi:MAG TPA: ABC transporter ATP-binding protein [Oligoflexia bacterium]|nr:ABC transporter ATP-binding protein [Oligoflexia bacterium]HMR24396.1 ABC transporter ATP-binding protein [Oligoflexia bacterium]
MIEAQHIHKVYGDITAVKDISFRVKKGEILGFLGANGAGKTTTMRIMTGSLQPSSGTALIAGYDILKEPLEVKRRIGYLPESPPVYFDFTVEAFLKFVAKIREIPSNLQKQQIEWAIDKCGLKHVAKRMIGNLSKGYKQRVGLAQAIVHKPDVLILDEPTVGLDPTQIREIRALIQTLSEEHTIILSTHILPEVNMICDRAVFVHQGQIALEGSIKELTQTKSLEEVFVDVMLTQAS